MNVNERPAVRDSILVVDDNEENQLVAEAHLQSFGYGVVLASNGQEALERFAAGQFSLVLLDIQMPVMDGFETCRRLRAMSRGADVPIVLLTALGDAEVHAQAVAAQADDFLMKPIRGIELLIRVRSLIRLHTLQVALLESNRIIGQQRDALLQAQERRRMLSAMIVHDLKNPLSGAVLNGRWLLKTGTLRDDCREAMLDVMHSCDSMHRLVMDLLDVERSETGKLAPKLEPLAPAELVETCVRDHRARSREGSHTVVTSVDRDLPQLRADKDLLLRVLGNLTENAAKYAPRGSEIRIEVRHHDSENLRIVVCDEGPGVPAELRTRIFEPYSRLDRDSGLHARESHGLGLAFCRLAIEAHGGRIWVEPGTPTGSAFCIELPLSAAS